MKKAYKDTARPMGVYRITITQNNKAYIGFAIDVPARINRHKAELRFGSHRNTELQEIWKSFGESALEFEVLDILDHEKGLQANPAEELHILLQMWTQKLEKQGYIVLAL